MNINFYLFIYIYFLLFLSYVQYFPAILTAMASRRRSNERETAGRGPVGDVPVGFGQYKDMTRQDIYDSTDPQHQQQGGRTTSGSIPPALPSVPASERAFPLSQEHCYRFCPDCTHTRHAKHPEAGVVPVLVPSRCPRPPRQN